MIPAIPKPPTAEERAKSYQQERDEAAYKLIADNMDRILHGRKAQETVEAEYDVLGR